MTARAREAAARPAPTVRPPHSRAADRLLKAAMFPLTAGVCGAMMAWLAHRTGPAIAIAAVGIGTALALALAAAVFAVRSMRFNPWPVIAVVAAAGAAAGWRLLPLAGLAWLRVAVAAAALAGIVKVIPAGVRYHRRRAAYYRWAQTLAVVLAQSVGQIEQVLAGLARTARQEHVTAPHFGVAPGAAWSLRVTRWRGDQILQAVLSCPAHDDISNPDFLIKVRDALIRRAGASFLSLSVNPLRDEITITVLDGPASNDDPLTVKDRAVERVKTVAGMALKNVQVVDADLDTDATVPAGDGVAGAGHALREFAISFDPAKIVTSPLARDQITAHISTQLFGVPDRLRARWEPDHDRATFKRRRDFPEFILHRILDLAVIYPGRIVLPYGEDEDGNTAVYRLSKTTLPHGLVVGPTGGGKTQLLLLIAIEAARQGVEVRGCDPKMIELMGLRGWPNVTQVATRVTDMIKLIEDVHTEMYQRFEDIATGKVPHGGFRRLLVILDEYFVFCMLVATWWQANRGPSDPKEHPVIRKIGELAALSRGADINLVLGCQRPDSTFFYEGARDNFGWRVSLGQLSQQGALMVWGDAHTGTDLPVDVPGLCTATLPSGPGRVKVDWVPNPALGLSGQLSAGDLAYLRTLLPEGANWDGPLPAEAPDPGFEASAAAGEALAGDPVTGFLTLVRMTLSSRTAHLTAVPGGGSPADGDVAGLYGWGAGPGGLLERCGTYIGSVEDTKSGRRVYLHPQRAYEVAQRFAAELTEPLDLTRAQLDEAMRRSGLLRTEKTKAETRWTVRRDLPGNDLPGDDRQRVWDIPEDALLGDGPANIPAAAPPAQRCPEPGPAPEPVSGLGGGQLPGGFADDPHPADLAEGDRVVLYFDNGEVVEVTVHSVTPSFKTPGHLVINYIHDDGTPDAVEAAPDQPIRRAPARESDQEDTP